MTRKPNHISLHCIFSVYWEKISTVFPGASKTCDFHISGKFYIFGLMWIKQLFNYAIKHEHTIYIKCKYNWLPVYQWCHTCKCSHCHLVIHSIDWKR